MDGAGPKADITCALNFSYFIFKERQQLLRYFKAAYGALKRDGIFVLDLLGGPDAMGTDENREKLRGFTYIWEQASFDPLTHAFRCHIHFELPGGKHMKRAFTYDWRLWTAPELRDLLHEAGFAKVHLMWEKTDADGDGLGVYYEPKRAQNEACWWTYVVAER